MGFIYRLQSKTLQLLIAMASVISPRQHLTPNREDILPPKNILKNKPTNQPPSKPQSKHSFSEQRNFRPNMRSSIEKVQLQENHLLLQKRAVRGEGGPSSPLRNIIQAKEEEYRESKPFTKKYGTQNSTHGKNLPTPQSRQQKTEHVPSLPEGKNRTKESFNKKLNSNIIKDEQDHPSRQSYRIKKIQKASPKKIRDQLIVLNEEEYKLQIQILELHKNSKNQLEEYRAIHRFSLNNVKKYFQNEGQSEELPLEHFLQKIEERLKQKKIEESKIEARIDASPYLNYLKNLPQDIMELHSSQEEDQVQELPQTRPRMENNIGSYATGMPGLKDKKYALNLRRTYDIFKDEQRQSRMVTREHVDQGHQEKVKQDGENKMTVNNKLKDFLLS